MAGINDLNQILFPVEEGPVFTEMKTLYGDRRIRVPDKKAIFNSESGCVMAVVGRGYRLVNNREALDFGYACCQAVFPETKSVEWAVVAVDARRAVKPTPTLVCGLE